MSKRWTLAEDMFLAKYFDAMGDMIGVNDLDRPKGAATKRVKVLKEKGAWKPLRQLLADEFKHLHAYWTALGDVREANWLVDIHPGAPERVADND